MKVKTSVSLSKDLLDAIDAYLGATGQRSEFIEKAIRCQLREIRRVERDARDAEIYARLAEDPEHQRDVADVHAFSVPWPELGDEVELSDEVLARLARKDALREAG